MSSNQHSPNSLTFAGIVRLLIDVQEKVYLLIISSFESAGIWKLSRSPQSANELSRRYLTDDGRQNDWISDSKYTKELQNDSEFILNKLACYLNLIDAGINYGITLKNIQKEDKGNKVKKAKRAKKINYTNK